MWWRRVLGVALLALIVWGWTWAIQNPTPEAQASWDRGNARLQATWDGFARNVGLGK